MASVVKRRRKDGSFSWYARYRDGTGKDVWKKCTSAKEAKAVAAEADVQLARSGGTWSPPAKVTVADYSKTWLNRHGPALRPRTLATYQRVFDQQLVPEFGATPLAALTRAQIKDYAAQAGGRRCCREHGPQRDRSVAGDALERARGRPDPRQRRPTAAAPGRPTRQADRRSDPRAGRGGRRAAGVEGRGPILLAATTGLRRGEVFGLRWRDVDFDARLIHVRQANNDGTLDSPKTAAGTRIVPMFGSVRQLPARGRARSPLQAHRRPRLPRRRRRTAQPQRLHQMDLLPGDLQGQGQALPLPRPPPLLRLAADRPGRRHPPDRPRRRPRRPVDHVARLLALDG